MSLPPCKYVFGPVPSRRLGRSLGVDLAPRKVCSFDCCYCQVGRTTRLSAALEHFAPVQPILAEIAEKLRAGPRPDHITLSGSGEPTLNADLAEIITGVRKLTDVPIAILTNGSMLRLPEVRAACAQADVVLPTLDAPDEETFQKIHRPAPGVTLEETLRGLELFRREFRGQIWVEVFLIAGVNTAPEQIRRIREKIERFNPDRIQLNTAVRPTADAGVRALTEAELASICALFGPKAEAIADFRAPASSSAPAAGGDAVLDMIRRRPVTAQDIADGMALPLADALKQTQSLLAAGKIIAEKRGDKEYFRPA